MDSENHFCDLIQILQGENSIYLSENIEEFTWYNYYSLALMKYIEEAITSRYNCMTVMTWKKQEYQ